MWATILAVIFLSQTQVKDTQHRERKPAAEPFGPQLELLYLLMLGKNRPLWYLPGGEGAPSPRAEDIRQGMAISHQSCEAHQSELRKMIQPDFLTDSPRKTVFEIEHWPTYDVGAQGFAYSSHGGQFMWVKMEPDYFVLFSHDPGAEPKADRPAFAKEMARRILKLSRPIRFAKMTSQQLTDTLCIGCFDYTKKKGEKARWDDRIFFCTDGNSVGFVFGDDAQLELPKP